MRAIEIICFVLVFIGGFAAMMLLIMGFAFWAEGVLFQQKLDALIEAGFSPEMVKEIFDGLK